MARKRQRIDKIDEHTTPSPRDDSPTGFLNYFKTYVNGWVAAALLLPTAITWKGMPIYQEQRGLLTTYTALSCALILAFLFSSRDLLPKFKTFIGRISSVLVAFVMICATGYSGYKYIVLLNESAYYAGKPLRDALTTLSMSEVHAGSQLMSYYILTMVFAECSFFFMAFREWRR